MKKKWSETRSKDHNRRISNASIKRRIERRAKAKAAHVDGSAAKSVVERRARSPVQFYAPAILSLSDHPTECVNFFADLYSFHKRRNVFVDLSMVTKITPDAIALLVSLVLRIAHRQKVNISGNYPDDLAATEMIRASGFDHYLKSSAPSTAKLKGAILKRDVVLESRQANPQDARRLIDFAAKDDRNIGRLRGAYENLLECMGNTRQHAAKTEGTENWWASVFKDNNRGCDCFTFVDMGVGIFESVELNLRLKILSIFNLGRIEVMQKLLAGEIPSSTGKHYRGKGLPSIRDSLMIHRALSRLVLVTNDVYVDVEPNRFEKLSRPLNGLLLYWEVPYANRRVATRSNQA
ncbi:MAG: hypothetical protein WBY44_29480 [Bryobacteraceae bacterium]